MLLGDRSSVTVPLMRPSLAVHRTIVVVDVEGFGNRRRTNAHRVAIRAGLYRALRWAFESAGVPWTECDHDDCGDGVYILVPAEVPKAPVVELVPPALVTALREHNTAHRAEERFRLRMALHAGEVVYDEHGATAASVILAFRLLDSPSLKAALGESPGVLALIVSDLFFTEVVRHSAELDPATFRSVRVRVKETSTTGWLSLPDHPYPPDDAHVTAVLAGEPAVATPRQLPAPPNAFTGREDDLARLSAALDSSVGPGGTMLISAVAGTGGMGKTWLALHWAYRHLDDFPDGQLFVDLRGFSPDGQPMAVGAALRGFLDALDAGAPAPVDVHAQAARYRGLVAGKRMLVVLDNAADTAQVVPLLPGSPTVSVLVTSRNRLAGLISGHGAQHLPVGVLSHGGSRALLEARIGAERIAAEPAAVDEILAFCGGFPLALSVIAGRAQMHAHLPLATLATELREAGLHAFDDDDPAASLSAVLSWSYRALNDDQASAFGLLGIAPGPDISLRAAASLTGLPTSRVGAVLRGLTQSSLLGQDNLARYGMHDLVRRYAIDTAHTGHPETERMAASRRAVDFYLHTARAGDRLLYPHRLPIKLDPPAPGCCPHSPPDHAAAIAWFDAEHRCLLAAQRTAAAHGWQLAVWQLAWTLSSFHLRRGHLQDDVAAWQAGLAAADDLGDPGLRTVAHRCLGHAHARAGRYAAALDHLQQAFTLAKDNDDAYSQGHALWILAWTEKQRGDVRRALAHAAHALCLFRTLGNPAWEADALSGVGWYAAHVGDHDQARHHCDAALALHREHGNRNGEADTLDTLGYIAHHTGDHTRAIDDYQRALDLRRELGNTYEAANTLDQMGHPLVALGQYVRARTAWWKALELYQVQHRSADVDRVRRQLEVIAREPTRPTQDIATTDLTLL
jgi:tetratricopeptide (TPR) repeat protein